MYAITLFALRYKLIAYINSAQPIPISLQPSEAA